MEKCLAGKYARKYSDQDKLLDGAVDGVVLKANEKHPVRIGNWFSPLEFHVTFEVHVETLTKFFNDMNETYDKLADSIEAVVDAEVGLPCAVMENGIWKRARVEIIFAEELNVTFVDSGFRLTVPSSAVKHLLIEYAVYPPLGVMCSLMGCHKDICYRDILDAIRASCRRGRQRCISFAESSQRPLAVKLFDMALTDLFDKHFGTLLKKLEIAAMQREDAKNSGNSRRKARRMSETTSTEEEDYIYDSSEDEMDFSSGKAIMKSRKKLIPNIDDVEAWPSLK